LTSLYKYFDLLQLDGLFENLKEAKNLSSVEVQRTKALSTKAIMIGLVIGFAFMAYSYQTGTYTDLWIAYLVTGIPIAIEVVIAVLILFLFILRYATKRKIAKSRRSRLILLDRVFKICRLQIFRNPHK